MRAGPNAKPDRFARGVIAGWLSVTALAVAVRIAQWARTTDVARSLSAWLNSPIGVTWGELILDVAVVAVLIAMIMVVVVTVPAYMGGARR